MDPTEGVYLINAVDTVTQFQFIPLLVERISEHYLLPGVVATALEALTVCPARVRLPG